MLILRRYCLLLLVLAPLSVSVSAEAALRVVSSVNPLHLLLRDIGGDAVDAVLLQSPQFSPHDMQLRPSDMQLLKSADLILWFGPALETNLRRPLRRYPQAVALFADAQSGRDDPHFWLDAGIVQDLARRLARMLSEQLPSRSAYFHANAARFVTALRQYDKQLVEQFSRVAGSPSYLLLHDGFARFEGHYGLTGGQALMSGDDRLPGARHLVELRRQLQRGDFACVFREPQYPGAMLRTLTEGVDVAVIELDPMGLAADADQGFLDLYRRLGDAFLNCFQQSTDRSAA